MKIWKILLILVGIWGVLEMLGRLLFHLWMNHEIQILGERIKRDEL